MGYLKNLKENVSKMYAGRPKLPYAHFSGNILKAAGTLTESHTNSSGP